MKKKFVIIFRVILSLIRLMSIGSAVIFAPRKIAKLIDVETIGSVEFIFFAAREIEEFAKLLSDVPYKIRLSDTKCLTIYDKKQGTTISNRKIYCDLTRFLEI